MIRFVSRREFTPEEIPWVISVSDAFFECLFWIRVVTDPRCSKSVEWSRQCERTDTEIIRFSDKYLDWARGCPEHRQYYLDWANGPLIKIRSGR